MNNILTETLNQLTKLTESNKYYYYKIKVENTGTCRIAGTHTIREVIDDIIKFYKEYKLILSNININVRFTEIILQIQ